MFYAFSLSLFIFSFILIVILLVRLLQYIKRFAVDSHLRDRLRRTAVLGTLGSDVLFCSASEGKFLGCGLDSSVFCHQSA